MDKNLIVLPDGRELGSGAAEGDAIRALTFMENVNADEELMPGTACLSTLDIEIWAPDGTAAGIRAGDELVWYRVGADGARQQMGLYTAEKPTRTGPHTCRLTACDRMARAEQDLSAWLRGIQAQLPMPLLAFARAVCAQCGLRLANTDLPNGSYAVPPFYTDGLTARQLLQWVGEAAGCFCRATPDGELEFSWYAPADWRRSVGAGEDGLLCLRLAGDTLRVQDGTPPDDGPQVYRVPYKQTWYYQNGLSFEDYATAPIDKVQIRQSQSDVGVVYPPDAAGANALVLTGNLLLTAGSAAALQPVAQTLYERLRGVSYTPCRLTVPADCGLRAGMAAWVTDANGQTFLTYFMQATLADGRLTLESTGSPSRASAAAVNTQRQRDLRGRLLEVQASVDGLDIKASELAGGYAELQARVEGISSTVQSQGEALSTVRQSAEEFSVEVQDNYTRNDAVRSRFALDPTSVEVTSGEIAFKSNTITIDSDNFKLTKNGTISAKGDFTSGSDTIGDAITMRGGILRIVMDGQEVIGFASADSQETKMGIINVWQDGVIKVRIDGGDIYFYDTAGNLTTRIGTRETRIGGTFQPYIGKSKMYLDWTLVKGTDGNDYWALCGYDAPR